MRIKDFLNGIGLPPAFVGAVRAIGLAIATAAIGAAITQAELLDWGQFAVASPVVMALLRGLEGVIDQWQTPNQNNV